VVGGGGLTVVSGGPCYTSKMTVMMLLNQVDLIPGSEEPFDDGWRRSGRIRLGALSRPAHPSGRRGAHRRVGSATSRAAPLTTATHALLYLLLSNPFVHVTYSVLMTHIVMCQR